MATLTKIGLYALVVVIVCLWAYGQYFRGKKFYDRDRKSGVQGLFPKDK